jgi:hypothetical protein
MHNSKLRCEDLSLHLFLCQTNKNNLRNKPTGFEYEQPAVKLGNKYIKNKEPRNWFNISVSSGCSTHIVVELY